MKFTRIAAFSQSTQHLTHRITIFAALALLVGCAATRPQPRLLSAHAVVLETPIVAQDELYECGLVAISALCDYYRAELPAEERKQLVIMAAEQKGLSGAELRDELMRCGLDVFIFRGSLDDEPTGLINHVNHGRPVIVMTSDGGLNHYSLFIGYDLEFGSVVLLDPRRGRVVLPTNVFAQSWAAADQFTLLAVPRSAELENS